VFVYQLPTTGSSAVVSYQLIHVRDVLLSISYFKGTVEGDVTLNGCSLNDSSVVANGILHVKLDPLQDGDEGVYIMYETGVKKDCTGLYIIGMLCYFYWQVYASFYLLGLL